MDDRKLEALSQIEIFKDLNSREIAAMEQITSRTTCEAGRVFYAPEETGEVLFLLKKGRVQLYRLTLEGKKLVVAVLEGGAIFGEMALIGQGMHNTFAEAIEPCTLCVMSRPDIERIILENPKVALRFLEAVTLRLREAESKLEQLAFKSIPARLAMLLLELSDQAESPSVVQGYTHQTLAEMLGTYRETITQVLNQFRHQGWIDIRRKCIEILSPDALQVQTQA